MKKIVLAMVAGLLVPSVVPRPSFASPPIPAQQQSQQQAKTFTGTIVKSGDNFVLSDSANKIAYVLDNSEKASQFEGKKVKVTGTVDIASNMIHVETIQEIA